MRKLTEEPAEASVKTVQQPRPDAQWTVDDKTYQQTTKLPSYLGACTKFRQIGTKLFFKLFDVG